MSPEFVDKAINAAETLAVIYVAVGFVAYGMIRLGDRWGMFSTQEELNEQKKLREEQKTKRIKLS
ncbi:hypothetical protein HY085_00510 [Candidatus Gottesmanbacteria bacterium]|nr:hypothetical protein [Candidatus Gottesmanbacteria bacterium]